MRNKKQPDIGYIATYNDTSFMLILLCEVVMVLNETFFKIHEKKDSNGNIIECYITYGDGTVLNTNPATFDNYIAASKYLESFLKEQIKIHNRQLVGFKVEEQKKKENIATSDIKSKNKLG
ncbi:hypothetical protein R5R04_000889 [Klebsiella aerogenes]|uniref:hypothetical protein n=1 Tax=Serratia marcescens TaxID=615 RepID=UPI00289117E9|nr:hypothetical protein [Serratia marcescens]ELS6158423.1 hypothetical protein [Klebsiella aerogenes]EMB4167410.1 hypothetical protein [Salmonella enterica]